MTAAPRDAAFLGLTRALADHLPPADPLLVQDLVVLAGADATGAIVALADALAAVIATRVDQPAHTVFLGAAAHRIARGTVLRASTAGQG